MGEMQPISGVQSSEGASSGSGGGGFLSWITGAGNVQKAEPKVRVLGSQCRKRYPVIF